MKTLLIVVGIIVLLWLGFLTINRNGVQLHLNRHDEKIFQHDKQFDTLDQRYQTKDGVILDGNPINKGEETLDRAEDKLDKKIEMPYEKSTTNENDNLLKDDNTVPPANNKDEIDLKPNPNLDNENGKDKKPHKNPRASLDNQENVVAFGYITDYMFKGNESIEAFELDKSVEDVITAFRVR